MSLKDQIKGCLLADQRKFTKKWHTLRSLPASEQGKALEHLQHKINHSQSIVQARAQGVRLTYPDLPICQAKDKILELIQHHQVILIAGETGSGKSTQLAKMCLELNRGIMGWIGHTQPRRLAARTIADRIAEEMAEPLGNTVGYKVRFSEKVAMKSRIKVMTDGILLNELQFDRLLLHYDTLIIDEAHERSLNIDILLGTIKTILPKRPDLKVIITSATLALEKFAQFFENVPCLSIEGKAYPIDLHYLPRVEEEDYFVHVTRGIEAALHHTQGDVLVFLSGEGEIHQAQKSLRGLPSKIEVIPLYARLSLQEQRRVFHPGAKRRVILSTNVAETSLTVPNISAVVDPGFARVSRYSYRSKIQRLPIEPVSQSSCQQRMGRAGRVRHGVCFRLFNQEDFDTRPFYTEPEIQRTNLASVILRMLMLKLGNIESFPFLDAPDPRWIRDGINQLERLGAIDHGRLTSIGYSMAQLPIEPKLAKILLSAQQYLALTEVLIIVSGLSIQDPREYPKEKLEKAQSLHAQYQHPKSNFMELLNVWHHLTEKQAELSGAQFRKYCQKNMIHPLRWFEWQDVHQQLQSLCKDLSFKFNTLEATYEGIHKALLSGFFETIGRLSEDKKGYEGPRGIKFLVPKQKLKSKPDWVMASHLVETKQVFASGVSEIQATWLEEVAPHCCKYQTSDLFWDPKSGYVRALSQVTFFGLIIAARKPTPLSQVPIEGRQVFIRQALLEHGLPSFEFWRHNQSVVKHLRDLETRWRRPDALFDEEALFEWYEQKLPENLYSVVDLQSFIKAKGEEDLKVTPEIISLHEDLASITRLYPDSYKIDSLVLPLSYVFDLDSVADGVTVHIPVGVLQGIQHHEFHWGIPGLLEEKLEWMINRLPKNFRRRLPPMKECIPALMKSLNRELSFEQALMRVLRQQYQVPVTEAELKAITIPEYLTIRFRIEDDGKVLAEGRDLTHLIELLGHQSLSNTKTTQELTQWDFGALPPSKEGQISGQAVTLYPALVDHKRFVRVEEFIDSAQANKAHPWGVVRLMMLIDSKNGSELMNNIIQKDTLKKQARSLFDADTFLDELILLTYHYCCLQGRPAPRMQHDFEQALKEGKPKLGQVIKKLSGIMLECFTLYQEVQWLLVKAQREKALVITESLTDIEQQRTQLFQKGFLLKSPMEWLLRYPTYLQAIKLRLEKLLSQPLADLEKLKGLKPFINEFQRLCPQCITPSCQNFRWALEEYRILLFAQPIKAKMTVSPNKLKQWLKEIV